MAPGAWATEIPAGGRLAAGLATGQHAEPAQHDAANSLAGIRVLGEWRSVHALFDFVIARFFAGLRRDVFVNVGGHTNSLSVEICGLKKLAQLLRQIGR